jgi:hypothetical protein
MLVSTTSPADALGLSANAGLRILISNTRPATVGRRDLKCVQR